MMDQLQNLLSNCRGIICLHGGRMHDYGGILLYVYYSFYVREVEKSF